jgi:hypothetical protein
VASFCGVEPCGFFVFSPVSLACPSSIESIPPHSQGSLFPDFHVVAPASVAFCIPPSHAYFLTFLPHMYWHWCFDGVHRMHCFLSSFNPNNMHSVSPARQCPRHTRLRLIRSSTVSSPTCPVQNSQSRLLIPLPNISLVGALVHTFTNLPQHPIIHIHSSRCLSQVVDNFVDKSPFPWVPRLVEMQSKKIPDANQRIENHLTPPTAAIAQHIPLLLIDVPDPSCCIFDVQQVRLYIYLRCVNALPRLEIVFGPVSTRRPIT